jgi:hypothetical protein
MEQHWMNLLLFIGILIGAYLIFRYINFNTVKEGLDNNTTSSGIAGGASTYNEKLKAQNTQKKETLSIKSYRKDYENIILNLDESINIYLLETLLNMTPESNKLGAIYQLFYASGARTSLNNLIKYIDKQ